MFEKPIVLDGGVTTELETEGYDFTGTKFWGSDIMIECPDKIIPTHKRFLSAGAQILQTNTYKLPMDRLQDILEISPEKAQEIINKSVDSTRKAIREFKETNPQASQKQIYIAGSIGPFDNSSKVHRTSRERKDSHTCYMGGYVEDFTEKDMEDYHYKQASAVWEAGVDILAIEAVPALLEAKAILRALDRLPQVKAWVAFTCRDGSAVGHGEPFAECARLCFANRQVVAVGINCSNPANISSLLRTASEHQKAAGKPFIVYPNSGEMYSFRTGWSGAKERAASWEMVINEWHKLGVKIFGGCCRVYSQDIKQIADAVGKLPKS